jgi:hypothetical protein
MPCHVEAERATVPVRRQFGGLASAECTAPGAGLLEATGTPSSMATSRPRRWPSKNRFTPSPGPDVSARTTGIRPTATPPSPLSLSAGSAYRWRAAFIHERGQRNNLAGLERSSGAHGQRRRATPGGKGRMMIEITSPLLRGLHRAKAFLARRRARPSQSHK